MKVILKTITSSALQKPIMAISTMVGLLIGIGTCLYYFGVFTYTVSTKYKDIQDIQVVVKNHIIEQAQQFKGVDGKLDKLDDKMDKKFDDQNDKLYSLAQSMARIERANANQAKNIALAREVENISVSDMMVFKPLSIESKHSAQ